MYLEGLYSTLFNIIHFGIVLGLAVIFHEWGHFIVAKLLGAKVDRFAVGFGKTRHPINGTRRNMPLCALPLGGYVKVGWTRMMKQPARNGNFTVIATETNFNRPCRSCHEFRAGISAVCHNPVVFLGSLPCYQHRWLYSLSEVSAGKWVCRTETRSWQLMDRKWILEAVLRNEHNYDSEAGILTVTINRNGEIIENQTSAEFASYSQ